MSFLPAFTEQDIGSPVEDEWLKQPLLLLLRWRVKQFAHPRDGIDLWLTLSIACERYESNSFAACDALERTDEPFTARHAREV